ncbi:MAG: phospho-N-acetylmuramoyl-pentapeptide-transferase [Ardenticatenales bacterium]
MSDQLPLIGPMATSLVVGFVSSALATWPLIGWLKRRQLGKAIREDGPKHQGKAGTPTMGGLGIVLLILVAGAATGLWSHHRIASRIGEIANLVAVQQYLASTLARAFTTVFVATAAFGAIGLLDDWQGLARKGRARAIGIGLSARRALLLQVVLAAGIAYALSPIAGVDRFLASGMGGTNSWGPTIAAPPLLSSWAMLPASVVAAVGLPAWIAAAALVIVGTVNGVNLSDGLDGLAAGLGAMAFFALGLIVFRLPETIGFAGPLPGSSWSIPLALLSFVIAGACLGFLVHNRYPARVFMGNVTSMALGGALATIALATGTWLLLPVIGIVYVAEVLSDIIQIGYFKWTGGKRFFRMAPLHHHFELLGMHETAVTRRFWLAGALGAAVAVGFVYYATWGV